MMGRSQRSKGKRGEREVAELLGRFGITARRTRQVSGATDPDVRVETGWPRGTPKPYIEVKRRAAIAALSWLRRAEEDARECYGRRKVLPIVFMRSDGDTRWSVLIDAHQFLSLITR